jgi:hypothetical protein
MRYFPYDFLASRLYHKIFCDVEEESEDFGEEVLWGLLNIDSKPAWMKVRLAEATLLGRTLMEVNVMKVLERGLTICNPVHIYEDEDDDDRSFEEDLNRG